MIPAAARDLRLVVGALGGWVAAWWGLGHAASTIGWVTTVLLVAAGAGTLGAWRSRARNGQPLAVLAFVSCCAAAVLAPLGVRSQLSRSSELATLASMHSAVTVEIVLTSDPHPLAARGPDGSPRSIVHARTTALHSRAGRPALDRALDGSMLLFVAGQEWSAYLPGQRMRVDGVLAPPRSDNLLGATMTVRGIPRLIGSPPWWQRGAGAVREGLRQACRGLPDQVRGLLPGMVDGDTAGLDPVLAERFRMAGLTHLVAVSGTNCSIVVGAVAMLLVRARASPRSVALLSLVVLAGFVVVARPSPSVLRAATMAAIGLFAMATGRERSALPALGATVLVLLGWQPALARDAGFLLSVGATAALLLLAPGWAAALRRRRVPPGVAEAMAVAAAAHLVTAPVIAAISGRLSLVAIPANVLAEPVVAAATVLGALAAVLSVVFLPAASVCAQLAGWPCRWLVWVADRFGAVPGAALPWPSGIFGAAAMTLCCLLMGLALRRAMGKLLVLVAVVCCLVVQIPIRGFIDQWPAAGWLITACDVGQGDAIAVRSGTASAILVDTGPEPIGVDRCLRGLGISRITLLVLTHFHLDHVGGIAGALHDRTVDRALVSPLQEPSAGVRLVTNALSPRGVPLEVPVVGERISVGAGAAAVTITVLGPSHAFRDTRSDPNNSSIIMLAEAGGHRLLLAGDTELEAQDELLASGVDLHADILKVPHHGSAYSDPAFLAAVRPRIALISVGANNDYGHPSPLLISALGRLGAAAYRTDQQGDLSVIRHGADLRVLVKPVPVAARSPPAPPGQSRGCLSRMRR